MIRLPIVVAAAALASVPAGAEVIQSSRTHFEIAHTVTLAAPVERAWAVLLAPRLWWSKDHTYSEDSANLSLDERAGGCFCEKLPGKGGVEHMRVVYIQPPVALRLAGALGPLQAEAANGTLSFRLTKTDTGTKVTMTYLAGGYFRAGADKLAPVVDRVLALQLLGLQAAIEGAPTAAKPAAAAPRLDPAPLADVEQTLSGLPADAPATPEPAPAPAAEAELQPTPPKPQNDSPRA
ncbi:MAG: SRPBCC family protein [Pseudomonadota bacterium]